MIPFFKAKFNPVEVENNGKMQLKTVLIFTGEKKTCSGNEKTPVSWRLSR
jgi:hypothetical protein